MKPISEEDFNFLLKLSERYDEEAINCKKNGQVLASCVMYAARMQATILAIALVHENEVIGSKTYQRMSEPDLRKWQLSQLLDLSRELNWIPSSLPVGEIARTSGVEPDEALKRGDVGYFADHVREVRDMIHPGRYVRLWSGMPITNEFVESVEETVSVVNEILEAKLHETMKNSAEFQEWTRSRK
jgi:hypothetical protein